MVVNTADRSKMKKYNIGGIIIAITFLSASESSQHIKIKGNIPSIIKKRKKIFNSKKKI